MARIATRELVLDDVAVAIIEAAVDGDTEALDILPAQTFVHGEDAAALQEVLQEGILLIRSDGEVRIERLSDRGLPFGVDGESRVEGDDLLLGEGLLA